MTEHVTALREPLAKGTDAALLREMIGFAAERLMELEAGQLHSSGVCAFFLAIPVTRPMPPAYIPGGPLDGGWPPSSYISRRRS